MELTPKKQSKPKRVGCILLLLMVLGSPCYVLSKLLAIPNVITLTWQTVVVEDVCTFRVPAWWVVDQQDGTIYMTDRPRSEEGYKTYIVGTVWSEAADFPYREPHELLSGVVKGEYQNDGSGYSNSASYLLYEYFDNGERIERYLINFHHQYIIEGRVSINLLVWNQGLLYKKTVSKITKSLERIFYNSEGPQMNQDAESVLFCTKLWEQKPCLSGLSPEIVILERMKYTQVKLSDTGPNAFHIKYPQSLSFYYQC